MPIHVTESVDGSMTNVLNFSSGGVTILAGATLRNVGTMKTDTVSEDTTATGVMVDSVRCKDGGVSTAASSQLSGVETNTVSELTSAVGVTIDSVLCKDGGVSTTASSSLNGAVISGAFSLASDQVQVTEGGTGLSSASTGDILYASGANTFSALSAGTSGQMLRYNASGVPIKNNLLEHVVLIVTAPSTAPTAVSDAAQFYFPFAGYIQTAFAGVSTSASGTSTTVDVWLNTTTIFSTKLTIDTGETTSITANTPAVISAGASAFALWDQCRVHVDSAGTTPGAGLIVELTCVRLS